MRDWATDLRDRLGPDLANQMGLNSVDDGPGFEAKLGRFFAFQSQLPLFEEFVGLARPGPVYQDDTLPSQMRKGLRNQAAAVDEVVHAMHSSLFDLFGPDRIDETKARNSYYRLFDDLGITTSGMAEGSPHNLIIASTNYDRAAELALLAGGASPRTGQIPHPFRTPIIDPTGIGEFDETNPSILYLHGAVGWYQTAQGTINCHSADRGFQDTNGVPAVLYPEPNKAIESSITRSLWNEFDSALTNATHVLVLGHSLHDEHLVQRLRASTASVAITYWSGVDDTEEEETRIRSLVPSAVRIAMEFGPDLQVDEQHLQGWFRRTADVKSAAA